MPYKSGMSREQITLFPETIDEYITDENEVQFIDAFIDNIEIEFKYSKTHETGRPHILVASEPLAECVLSKIMKMLTKASRKRV